MFEGHKLGVLSLFLIVGIAAFLPAGCGRLNPTLQQGELRVKIGEFESKDAGVRAAIKRLAAEVEAHPNQEIYRIVWIGPFSDETETARQAIDRRALVYSDDGPLKVLGYEHDVGSGRSGRCYCV